MKKNRSNHKPVTIRTSSSLRAVWSERLRFPWWMGGALGAWAAAPVLYLVWRSNLGRLADLVESGALDPPALPPG